MCRLYEADGLEIGVCVARDVRYYHVENDWQPCAIVKPETAKGSEEAPWGIVISLERRRQDIKQGVTA